MLYLNSVENAAASKTDKKYAMDNQEQMKQIAAKCEFFSPTQLHTQPQTCQHCKHLDQQVYMCPTTNRVVIHYEWTTPAWISAQA